MLAIGNPFGFGNTVTLGIVSALGRNHLGINRFEDFIQTDAAINPGNSGGALVDTAGNLIGINSTIYSQSGGSMGIGFAIPVSLARTVLEQIIKDGEVTRGWLGVEPQSLTREAAQALALATHRRRADPRAATRRPGRPRRHPGARRRVEIGGKPTPDVPQLLARIAELPPGSNARIKVWRDGKPVDVDVVVARSGRKRRNRRTQRAPSVRPIARCCRRFPCALSDSAAVGVGSRPRLRRTKRASSSPSS